MVIVLSAFRDGIANNLIIGKPVEVPNIGVSEKTQSETEQSNEENENQEKKDENSTTKLVRFLNAVPKFVGTELEEYGPFEEEDIANLPLPIADLLLEKGKVEEIKS